MFGTGTVLVSCTLVFKLPCVRESASEREVKKGSARERKREKEFRLGERGREEGRGVLEVRVTQTERQRWRLD